MGRSCHAAPDGAARVPTCSAHHAVRSEVTRIDQENDVGIAESVASASAYLREHPEEARYRDSLAHAHLDAGLAVVVSGPSGESLRTDMPKGIGGGDTAPSPGWIFRAAAASGLASPIPIPAAA